MCGEKEWGSFGGLVTKGIYRTARGSHFTTVWSNDSGGIWKLWRSKGMYAFRIAQGSHFTTVTGQ